MAYTRRDKIVYIGISPHPAHAGNIWELLLLFVDDASRGTWVYWMRARTEASKLLQGFITIVQRQFNTNVKVVRSDNGSEFTSGPMKEFYFNHGVLRESSCI